MKFYIALLAVILLQGSIYSISLKESESLKLNLETETKTKTKDYQLGDIEHELSAANQVACQEEEQTLNEVNCGNPPDDPTTPQDPTDCVDPDQEVTHTWTIMDHCLKKFHDVGVSSEGAIVAIGTNGKLYLYDYDQDIFELVQGDFDLFNLRRVDIGYDGRIYAINYSGDTYMLNCDRFWVKLPGCAIDIGAGRGHEVVKIGCNDYCDSTEEFSNCQPGPGATNPLCQVELESPYVYKLICDCDCRCCDRRCNIFIKFRFVNCDQCVRKTDRVCYWIKYPNGPCWEDSSPTPNEFNLCKFSRIDVHPSGHPTVIGECDTGDFRLWQFIGDDKNVFKELVTSTTIFRDVCADNLGNIFYIKEDGSTPPKGEIYIYNSSDAISSDDQISNTPIDDRGTGISPFVPGWNISCGPYAQPTATDEDCCLWTTTKVGYN